MAPRQAASAPQRRSVPAARRKVHRHAARSDAPRSHFASGKSDTTPTHPSAVGKNPMIGDHDERA